MSSVTHTNPLSSEIHQAACSLSTDSRSITGKDRVLLICGFKVCELMSRQMKNFAKGSLAIAVLSGASFFSVMGNTQIQSGQESVLSPLLSAAVTSAAFVLITLGIVKRTGLSPTYEPVGSEPPTNGQYELKCRGRKLVAIEGTTLNRATVVTGAISAVYISIFCWYLGKSMPAMPKENVQVATALSLASMLALSFVAVVFNSNLFWMAKVKKPTTASLPEVASRQRSVSASPVLAPRPTPAKGSPGFQTDGSVV